MSCLITSSKLSHQSFEFSLKVKVMGSNSGIVLKSFLLYVNVQCKLYISCLQCFLKSNGCLVCLIKSVGKKLCQTTWCLKIWAEGVILRRVFLPCICHLCLSILLLCLQIVYLNSFSNSAFSITGVRPEDSKRQRAESRCC